MCRNSEQCYPKKIRKLKNRDIIILDFQLELLVYQKQLELSFFKNIAKTQSVPFPSYILIVIRCTGARFLVNFRFINCEIKNIYPQEAGMY